MSDRPVTECIPEDAPSPDDGMRQTTDRPNARSASHPSRAIDRSEAFLSNGMDKQKADEKHHRAGYAMN
jgi:hypothetical protein